MTRRVQENSARAFTSPPGSILEATDGGSQPVRLPTGEERRFLEDGDEIILKARGKRDGFATIGFGDCRAKILPANRP